MKYTIEDLKKGKCAVINDGTFDELKEVLDKAFPNAEWELFGVNKFYFQYKYNDTSFYWSSHTSLPTQSVKDFLVEDFVLPEKWCVLNPENEESYLLYDYANSLKESKINKFYPYKWGNFFHFPNYKESQKTSSKIEEGYTEITFEQFKKYVLKQKTENMETRFPFKLNEEQGKEIIEIACNDWKNTLADKWAKDFIIKGYTEITEEFYKEMRKYCTTDQHKMFDKIFGKDGQFEIGDWIYITNSENTTGCTLEKGDVVKIEEIKRTFVVTNKNPRKGGDIRFGGFRKATPEEIEKAKCPYKKGELIFVKYDNNGIWVLRYFSHFENGKVHCYISQQKEGDITYWNYHAPAKGVELPNKKIK